MLINGPSLKCFSQYLPVHLEVKMFSLLSPPSLSFVFSLLSLKSKSLEPVLKDSWLFCISINLAVLNKYAAALNKYSAANWMLYMV